MRLATTDVSVLKQVLIEKHYDFQVQQSPASIVDVGANIGLSAIYFANRFKKAKIIAVEPELSNFEILRRNVSSYPNITPVHAAIWHTNGLINLVDPGAGNHGFQTTSASIGSETNGSLVKAVTFETLLRDAGWANVDLLKVDIEGAEKELFESSSPWIGSVRMIMVELHDEMRSGCSAAFTRATAGFEDGGRCGESLMVFKK